jgi:3',5'-cyclic AMP phosphodiesterase CpdA
MNRKRFLEVTTAALAAGTAAPLPAAGAAAKLKSVLRIAYLTDVHVQPEGPSAKGFANALHKAQSLVPKAGILFNGGDAIYDALTRDKTQTQAQWDLWLSVLKQENSLPLVHCIGNHDVWGWDLKDKAAVVADKGYGKQWAVEALGLPNRYYSFDRAGWHFVVLDSTHPSPEFAYLARLDTAQMDWLKQDLQATPAAKPVCILSHIPILSFASQFFSGADWNNPDNIKWGRRALMHTDSWEIKTLLTAHPNVKLCLAGHLHMQETLHYLGTKFITNGAVSGNWWKGNFQEFKPAFTVIDLFADGTSQHEWVYY